MATTIKRRIGSRSRSVSGRFGYGAGRRGSSSRTRKSDTSDTGVTATAVAPSYKGVCTTFAGKVDSFKTLVNQTKGPARCPRPSPATLNSFANWINKGAIVQTCSTAQVAKWARAANKNFNTRTKSVTSCKNILQKKFGKTTIKAVACTKSGSFIVATSPTCKGRNFCFPK